MPHGPWGWLTWITALGFPLAWARKPRWRDLAVLLLLTNLILVSIDILAVPEHRSPVVLGVLVALDLTASLVLRLRETQLRSFARRRAFLAPLALGLVCVAPLGLIEQTARLLSDLGIVRFHRPLQTVWRASADDWRMAMITGDENREPDPVLLWRPIDHGPFSSQRFKSPVVQVPKPAGVIRVMCYGDSLTDGPPKGGWPTWLGRKLAGKAPGRTVEVLNAGVVGYTSHQGLLRFLQEVDVYQPDLVLACFGWNDVAQAADVADKDFRIPSWPVVWLERRLVRYRAYLVLMEYAGRWRARPTLAPVQEVRRPRVALEDYLANLERFREEAARRGIPIVFLTRPHRTSASELGRLSGWRSEVPGYNEALRRWANRNHVPLIDAQAYFEGLPRALFADECHFVPAGYEELAGLVARTLVAEQPMFVPQVAGKPGSMRR